MKALRLLTLLLLVFASKMTQAQPEYASVDEISAAASNPQLWQQYQALQTGAQGGSSPGCSGEGHDRCGCSAAYFPWFHGLGNNDQWCIGPSGLCRQTG
jgi:hypothetical protein